MGVHGDVLAPYRWRCCDDGGCVVIVTEREVLCCVGDRDVRVVMVVL